MSAQGARIIPLPHRTASTGHPVAGRASISSLPEGLVVDGVEPALEPDSNPALESRLAEAVKLFEAGRSTEAAKMLEDVLRAEPGKAEALFTLGCIRHAEGSLSSAAALYTRAAEAAPGAWQPLYNHALLLESQGRTADATQCLIRAVAVAPSQTEPLLRLAQLAEASGSIPEARYWLLRLTEAEPAHGEGFLRLGLLELRQGRYAEAIPSFQSALAAESDSSAPAAYHLGLCYLSLGARAEARAAFEASVSREPSSPDSLLALASLALGDDDLETAEECERAIRALGQVPPALSLRLAAALQEAGDLELAKCHFRRAVLADPSLASGYFS
jgi:tetratricopeptide (TPR) repeat protein